MSIWMLLVFALCMLTGVLSLISQPSWTLVWLLAFVLTSMVFLWGLVAHGIRRPVV